jgi:hypothetical protein
MEHRKALLQKFVKYIAFWAVTQMVYNQVVGVGQNTIFMKKFDLEVQLLRCRD